MTIVFTDNFTGTVNTVVNGRVGAGGTWSCAGVGVNDIAGLKINASNQAKIATSNGCVGRIETGSANHYAKANIWTLTASAAVAVRAVDHLNFIGFRVTGSTQVELFKRIGGTETSVVKLTTATLSAPVLMQVAINGTSVTLFVNGAAAGAVGGYAVTDTVFTGITKSGLWGKSSGVDPLADDFEAGTVGAAMAAVGPANARSGTTDRNASVVASFALATAGSRSVMRDRNVALAASYAMRPGSARSATTDRNVAARRTGSIGPSASRLLQHAGSSGLSGSAMIAPARAVQAQRAGSAAVSAGAGLGIGPARSRLTQRAGTLTLRVVPGGTATPVAGELRIVAVPIELQTIAVPHN